MLSTGLAYVLRRREGDLLVSHCNSRTMPSTSAQALTMWRSESTKWTTHDIQKQRFRPMATQGSRSLVRIPSSILTTLKLWTTAEAAQIAFLVWFPISHHLASIRLKGANINLAVIPSYAPILKDIFFDNIQGAIDNAPS